MEFVTYLLTREKMTRTQKMFTNDVKSCLRLGKLHGLTAFNVALNMKEYRADKMFVKCFLEYKKEYNEYLDTKFRKLTKNWM